MDYSLKSLASSLDLSPNFDRTTKTLMLTGNRHIILALQGSNPYMSQQKNRMTLTSLAVANNYRRLGDQMK